MEPGMGGPPMREIPCIPRHLSPLQVADKRGGVGMMDGDRLDLMCFRLGRVIERAAWASVALMAATILWAVVRR